MSSHKITPSLVLFISLNIIASILPVYSHVLSDNPPDNWSFIDENFYNSINNSSFNVDELEESKKKVFNWRKKIKSRTLDINRLKESFTSLQSRTETLFQSISKLEEKLDSPNLGNEIRDQIIAKVKRKQSKIEHLQQKSIRHETLIKNKQDQIDLINPKLVQS